MAFLNVPQSIQPERRADLESLHAELEPRIEALARWLRPVVHEIEEAFTEAVEAARNAQTEAGVS